MNTQIAKQTVLVTGASSGIGQGIAIAFGKLGANVVVNYHAEKNDADRTLELIKQGGGNGFTYKADVGNEQEVKNMFKQTEETYGRLDVLVNNAGYEHHGY